MTASRDNSDGLCRMFDSFCKTLLKNHLRNCLRRENNLRKHEFASEDPLSYTNGSGAENDRYPSDSFVLKWGAYVCEIHDETLYCAMNALPEKQLAVLILDFWQNFSKAEIADTVGVSLRSVYNLRQRAYSAIKKYFAGKRNG